MHYELLPIEESIPSILESLRENPNLVLVAPPGAGKTTRVPAAMFQSGFAAAGEILVLEPRRLATRLAATRVASAFGEDIGETVGYTIRFEDRSSPRTRIRFLTEGVFARQMVANPLLRGVAAVILDEFHERHLANDMALSFARRLQRESRHDLRIVAMSATLDPAPLAAFLGDAAIVEARGRAYPLEITHLERPVEKPLEEVVEAGLDLLMRDGLDGDVLVFLPGAAEIRRCLARTAPLAARAGIRALPLHGDLPLDEQTLAVEPGSSPKVIFSTNVAESSVTIPGASAVIDSGLARMAGHSPWSGLPTLSVAKISRASADQRAGRAGRTRAGRVLRLYTRADYDSRPAHDVPEVRRADLSETLLALHAAGIGRLETFSWFDAPAPAAVSAAESLLEKLGAVDADGRITEDGRRMSRFPVHPRLGRIIVEGERAGLVSEACAVAALLSERDIRRSSWSSPHPTSREAQSGGTSDVIELLEAYEQGAGKRTHSPAAKLDSRSVDSVSRAHRQLCRLAAGPGRKPAPTAAERDESLGIALLSGFPDRVAMRRRTNSRELLFAEGGSAVLSETSAVHHAMLMVAVDAEERKSSQPGRHGSQVVVRLASAVEPEWLAALFPERVAGETRLGWNSAAGRVDEATRTLFGQLRLEESTRPAKRSAEASEMLAGVALDRELRDFADAPGLQALRTRFRLLAGHFPSGGFPVPDDEFVRDLVRRACAGMIALQELAGVSLCATALDSLTRDQRLRLDRELPESVTLAGGRRVRVRYEEDRPPWIESRLQDFFGMTSLPTICGGRLTLTAHLLAPSHRPVQVTADLAGFWVNHYPAVRRELQRRYPKHAWPEAAAARDGAGRKPPARKEKSR